MTLESATARVVPERCFHIRWKGMLIDGEPDPAAAGGFSESHICWCVLTQNCMGPDGQVVGEDICNFSRGCFVEC